MSSSYQNGEKNIQVLSFLTKQNPLVGKKKQHNMKNKLFQMNFHRSSLTKTQIFQMPANLSYKTFISRKNKTSPEVLSNDML
jgi:hypothetical protein